MKKETMSEELSFLNSLKLKILSIQLYDPEAYEYLISKYNEFEQDFVKLNDNSDSTTPYDAVVISKISEL